MKSMRELLSQRIASKYGVSPEFVAEYLAHNFPGVDLGQDYDAWWASLSEMSRFYADYAFSTNSRGEALVAKVEEFGVKPPGRHLDIGSGYGGTIRAFTSAGYECLGLELNPKLVGLARANCGSAARICQCDITSSDTEQFGQFDVITCDNVIEHVGSAERLVGAISLALRPTGLVYLTAPNAFSVRQVISECHYGVLGISLLDRYDAQDYFNAIGRHGVYDVGDYYSLANYISLFDRYGLKVSQLIPVDDSEIGVSAVRSELRSLIECSQNISTEFHAGRKLSSVLGRYIEVVNGCLDHFEKLSHGPAKTAMARYIHSNFGIELYYFIARRAT